MSSTDPITHDVARALTKHTPVDDGEGFLCSCSTASTLVDYTPQHLGEVWREARTIRTREQLAALLHADAGPHGLHGPVVRDRDHQVFEASTEYGGRRVWIEMGSAGPYCLSGRIALPARLVDHIDWNQRARDADA